MQETLKEGKRDAVMQGSGVENLSRSEIRGEKKQLMPKIHGVMIAGFHLLYVLYCWVTNAIVSGRF